MNKKFPVRTVVCSITQFSSKGPEINKVVIDVPAGWTFTHGYASHPTLRGAAGEIRKVFTWEPGARVEYEYYY